MEHVAYGRSGCYCVYGRPISLFLVYYASLLIPHGGLVALYCIVSNHFWVVVKTVVRSVIALVLSVYNSRPCLQFYFITAFETEHTDCSRRAGYWQGLLRSIYIPYRRRAFQDLAHEPISFSLVYFLPVIWTVFPKRLLLESGCCPKRISYRNVLGGWPAS